MRNRHFTHIYIDTLFFNYFNFYVMRKQFFSALLSLILFVLPISVSGAVYFHEDFNSITSGVPSGWSSQGGTVSIDQYRWSSYNLGYEKRGLRFNSRQEAGSTNILKTPVVNIPTDAQLRFRFKNPSGGNMKVCIVTPTSKSDTAEVLSADFLNVGDWTEYTFDLGKGRRGNVQIVFYSVSNGDSLSSDAYHYLDDVYVEDAATCARPVNLHITELSTESVRLNWYLDRIGEIPNSFKIIVRRFDDGAIVYQNDTLSAEYSTVLNGLEKGTRYEVTLKGDCNDVYKGNSLLSDVFYFSTLTDAVSLPLTDNFDKVVDMSLPSGWLNNTENSTGSFVQGDVFRGDKGKALSLNSRWDEYSSVITPLLDYPADDMQFTAWVSGKKNTKFSVGIMLDASNAETFIPILNDEIRADNEWQEVRIYTNSQSVSDSKKCFAIYLAEGDNKTLYVDDIDIRPIPTCIRPENLHIAGYDNRSAVLAWDQTGTPVEYEARFVSEFGSVITMTSATNPFTAEGLSAQTVYTASVRAKCGDNDYSEWSHSISFKTLCDALHSPVFSQGFENPKDYECWIPKQIEKGMSASGASDYGDAAWEAYGARQHSGSQSFRHIKTLPGTRTLLIAQPINIDEPYKYDVSYWVYRNNGGEHKKDEGVRLWVNNIPDTTGGIAYEFISNNTSYAPYPLHRQSSHYQQFFADIPLSGKVYLIFEGVSNAGNDTYIDDIEVFLAPECHRISNVTYSDIEDNSLKMQWKPGRRETEWVVRYTLSSSNQKFEDTVHIKGSPEFVFENLDKASYYTLEGAIASYCGVGDTSAWTRIHYEFETPCVDIVEFPYFCGFEDNVFPPTCWTTEQTVNGTGEGADLGDGCWTIPSFSPLQMNAGAFYSKTGNSHLIFNKAQDGTHANLVLPRFNFDADTDYKVKFSMYRYVNIYPYEGVKVWVSSTNDTTGGTMLAYIPVGLTYAPVPNDSVTGQYHDYEFDIPASHRGLQYVIFEGISSNGGIVRIDDIEVDIQPKCPYIIDVTLDSLMSTVANLHTKDATVLRWEAQYGPRGFELGKGTVVSSTTDNLTITGLTPNTDYDVYYRRDCSEANLGLGYWSDEPIQFTTRCAPIVIDSENEWFEGFESYGVSDPIGTKEDGYITVFQTGDFAFEGKSRYESASYPDQYYVHPYEGSRYAGRFGGYHNVSYSTWLYIQVHLEAGVTYEATGYFSQDQDAGVNCAIVCATYPRAQHSGNVLYLSEESPVYNKGWRKYGSYFTVPETGTYFIGYYTFATYRSAVTAMDNLRIRRVDCMPVNDVYLIATTENSATLNVRTDCDSVNIMVSASEFNPITTVGEVYNDTVFKGSRGQVNIENLATGTTYYYSVRNVCDNGFASDWSEVRSFSTRCNAIQLPYEEFFENQDGFRCWSMSYQDGKAYAELDTKVSHSGSASLRANGVGLYTPEFTTDNLSTYLINGWVMVDTSTVFEIGVMEDPNDVGTYYPVAEKTINIPNTWVEFTQYFDVLNTESEMFEGLTLPKHIVIQCPNNGETFYFDDIAIDSIQACPKPVDFIVSDVDATSAKLSWRVKGKESSWNIRIKANNVFVKDTVVTENPVVFDDLIPITDYEFLISAVCAVGDSSDVVSSGVVSTPCKLKILPYEENFDDFETNTVPVCWELGEQFAAGGTVRPWEVNSKRLRFYGNNSANTNGAISVIQSPILNLRNYIGAVLHFDYSNYDSDTLYVLVSTDGGYSYDRVVGRLPANGKVNPVPAPDIDLTEFVGNEVRIAFRAKSLGGTLSSYVFIDNIYIEPVEECSRPVSLRQIGVGAEVANLVINDTVEEHSIWQYVIGEAGFDHTVATPVDVTDHTFFINGLTPKSEYSVYIRSVCGDNYSSWRGPVQVVTGDVSDTIPYFRGFEGYNTDSLKNNNMIFFSEGKSGYGTDLYPRCGVGNTSSGGAKCLSLYSSDIYPYYILMPKFNEPTNRLRMSFDYRNSQVEKGVDSRLELGVLADSMDVNSFIALDVYSLTNVYSHVDVDFSMLSGDLADARIAFRYGENLAENRALYLDNIELSVILECPIMQKPELVSTLSDKIVLNADQRSQQFEVAYDNRGTEADSCKNRFITEYANVSINNLIPGTAYTVYTRAVCGENYSEWSPGIDVSTDCAVIEIEKGDVYIENFDTYNGVFPACFGLLETAAHENLLYPMLSTKKSSSKQYSMEMRGYNVLMLPLTNIPNSQLKLTLNVMNTSANLSLAYVTNSVAGNGGSVGDDENDEPGLEDDFYPDLNLLGLDDKVSENYSLTEVYSFAQNNFSFNKVALNIEDYNIPDDAYIVIFSKSSSTEAPNYIDNVTFEWIESCYAPKRVSATATDRSLTASWSQVADARKYIYELSSVNGTVVSSTVGAENSVTFNDLSSSTEYTFYVRAVCHMGDTTDWSDGVTVTTATEPNVMPFVSTFEDDAVNALWNISAGTNKFIIGSDSEGVKEGVNALYISGNDADYDYNEAGTTTTTAYVDFYLDGGDYEYAYLWRSVGDYMLASGTPIDFGKVYLTSTQPEFKDVDLSGILYNSDSWSEKKGTFAVADAGYYRLVVSWENDNGTKMGVPLAIDSVVIRRVACSTIGYVELIDVTDHSAKVKVVDANENARVWYRLLRRNDALDPDAVAVDTIDLPADGLVEFNELEPFTDYYLFVRSICGENIIAPSWKVLPFRTNRDVFAVSFATPFTETFETSVEGTVIDNGWNNVAQLGTQFKSNDNVLYHSRSGERAAVVLSGSKASMTRKFGLQVRHDYQFSVWANPESASADIPLSIVRIDNGVETPVADFIVKKDAAYAKYDFHFAPLEDGVYTFGIAADLNAITDGALVIDDIEFIEVEGKKVSDLAIESIDEKSVTLSWKGDFDSYEVVVSNEHRVVATIPTVDESCRFEGLSPSTNYSVSVVGITTLTSDTSEACTISFVTDCGVLVAPMLESFNSVAEKTMPLCWSNRVGTNLFNYSYNWSVAHRSATDNCMRFDASNAMGVAVLRSMPISIPSENQYMISFNYFNSSTHQFKVLISDDNGNTFSTVALTSGKTNGWADGSYDLAEFAGKTILIAFVGEAASELDGSYMAVDNMRITCKADDIVYNDTICAGSAYRGYGFSIPSGDVVAGDLTFYRNVLANTVDECDYRYILNLHVPPTYETSIFDTICAGGHYSDRVFENISIDGKYTASLVSQDNCDSVVNLYLTVLDLNTVLVDTICEGDTYQFGDTVCATSGVYTQVIESQSGCDSTVVLNLLVLRKNFEDSQIICEGDQVEWADTVLTTSGHYERYFKNSYGCDSVMIIDLTVLPTHTNISATICQGSDYIVGASVYSETGVYTTTLFNVLDCDSLVTLDLTVIPADTTYLYENVCEGKPYYGNGISGEIFTADTAISRVVKTAEGCDSVVELNIVVIPAIEIDTVISIKDGEMYEFGGNMLGQPGKYDHTFTSSEGCDSIVHLTLTVETGIESLFGKSLFLAPNPVEANGVTYINGDFARVDCNGLKVEILNSVGQVVDSYVPASFPIEVKVPSVSGIYYIRIVTVTGENYVEKIIVK